ncbi:secreted RxLR effector protein 161-like [Lathyrus oleraceus]|uniref:secreted RxLR effector protein 161-like n=1 Tax=Pisum sativum TaxID=3888 RepID=UPI0021CED9E9|nr:secreted RxLR effector protein 161-like [Pisum sativum]
MHPTCIMEKEVSDPRETRLSDVKRIIRYLKGTTNLGLFYRKSSEYKLVGYYEADYVGDKIERKSTSGSCQFLGDNLISWSSKRQSTIVLLIAETKYIAASGCLNLQWKPYSYNSLCLVALEIEEEAKETEEASGHLERKFLTRLLEQ